MSASNSSFTSLTPLDFYYLATSKNIFLYGFLIVMIIGFIGNLFQILTFSRRTMRNISTGVLFLALSISDTIYLCLNVYTLLIYGFQITDRSNIDISCKIRYFLAYITTNFSAWMLTTIAGDRWVRSRFPLKSHRICTPRVAIYLILFALLMDILLNIHNLTLLFGQSSLQPGTPCSAKPSYSTYVYFYINFWPIMVALSVTILPASLILFFTIALAVNVKVSRNRVVQMEQTNITAHEKRRANFLHQQMLILMLTTLVLFFLTTCPVAIFRFAIATLGTQQPFSLSILLAGIFGLITTINYSFNFYLHCLTSKLFRKEFCNLFPCSISIRVRHPNGRSVQQGVSLRQHAGTITQIMGKTRHIHVSQL